MRKWGLSFAVAALCGVAWAMPWARPLSPPEYLAHRLLLKGQDATSGWEDKTFCFEGPGLTNSVVVKVPHAALNLHEHYRFTAFEKSIRGLLGVELHAQMPRTDRSIHSVDIRPERPFRKYEMVRTDVAVAHDRIGSVSSNIRFPSEKAALEEAGATLAELVGKMPLLSPEEIVRDRMWLLQTRRIAICVFVSPVENEWTAGISVSDKLRNVLHFSFDPEKFDSEGDDGEFPYKEIFAQDTKMRSSREVKDFFKLKGLDAANDSMYKYQLLNVAGIEPVEIPSVSMQLQEEYALSDKEESLTGYFGAKIALGDVLPKEAKRTGGNVFTMTGKGLTWPFSSVQMTTNGLGRINMVAGAAGPFRESDALSLAGMLKSHFLLMCEMKPECVMRRQMWLFQTRRLTFVMTVAQNPRDKGMWAVMLSLHDKAGFGLK